jgi:hypothetical protein
MAGGPISPDDAIEAKIDWAWSCARDHGPRLLEDAAVRDLLSRLDAALSATRREMAAAKVIETCRRCEEEEGGSCCGAGIENRYDGILLLINALLGVGRPAGGGVSSSCRFLGGEGCRLRARHVLCVNYLCDQVTNRLEPSRLAALKDREGEELQLIFRLHDRLKRILAGR